MYIYGLMFLIPATIALFIPVRLQKIKVLWYLASFIFIIIIGFRLVGGDLGNYINHFGDTRGLELSQVLIQGDPGYKFINWLFNRYSWGFFAVTTIYAFISIYGLVKFLQLQPYPWLGFAVAVPYLIIVVYMGYMRQGVAIGFIFLALSALEKNKLWRYVFFVVLATTFHKTAIIMLSLIFFFKGKQRSFKIIGVFFILLGVFNSFLGEENIRDLYQNYIEANMQSQGAIIRVILNIMPALLLFKYRKSWKREFKDYELWKNFAIATIISFLFVKFASTAVDRLALYLIPLQIVVFARLPFLIKKNKMLIIILILIFYLLILIVWLNFASHSYMWIPYKNIIFTRLFQ